jgi:hypothetical protein
MRDITFKTGPIMPGRWAGQDTGKHHTRPISGDSDKLGPDLLGEGQVARDQVLAPAPAWSLLAGPA